MPAHGKKGRVLYGGYDLSTYLQSVAPSVTMENPEVTTFTKDDKVRIAGLGDGTMALAGFWDGATDAVDQVLREAFETADPLGVPVTACLEGYATIGARCRLMSALQASYEIDEPVDGPVGITTELEAAEDGMEGGVFLADLAARTANGNTSSVDNTAASSNGLVANLHVTAFTGFTSVTVKVQHSTDNIAWTDLITFTAVTANRAKERLEVTGTVNRYLRALWTVTVTGSITFAVAAARR